MDAKEKAAGLYEALQAVVIEAVNKALQGALPEEPKSNEVQPAFTRQDACRLIGCSLPTLDALLHSGQIKSFKIGRSVRVTRDSLETYLAGEAAE